MKWTVIFLHSAEIDLALIYDEANNKGEVTSACHQIDKQLQNDPDKKGQDYFGDRIIQYGPLAVGYELSPDDLIVRVFQVLRIRS